MAEMVHHTKAVVRGTKRALIVGDMPFLSYATPDEALENAGIFLREAGAQAVKVEGGVRTRARHRDAGPGRHPGHGPHRADAAGDQHDRQGPRPGQDPRAGARAPRRRARGPGGRRLRDRPRARPGAARGGRSPSGCTIPTIGIGAGAGCSGQVQVITDLHRPRRLHPEARPAVRATSAATIRDAARRLRGRRRRRHVPGTGARPSGWTTPSSTRSSVAARPTAPAGSIPVGRDPARPRPLNRPA